MFFSDYYGIDSKTIDDYGAVNISFACDIPLFIDPMLIFNSSKKEYKELHKSIVKYFHFLSKKSCNDLNDGEIKAWFEFNEVPNNWLGYSLSGNKGLALGDKFAQFLYKNIKFATTTNNISKSVHIEKVMLLYEGSGKDKISDLTVNLIKGYLCEYTELFANRFLAKKSVDTFFVDRVEFNYVTESFVSKEYKLPYIKNEKGKKEFVLLTPKDILREDEPAINQRDFINSYDSILSAIENVALRATVNNYIVKAVKEYEDKQKRNRKRINEKSVKKAEKYAFIDAVKNHPELYDYYIKMIEDNSEKVKSVACDERDKEIKMLLDNAKILIDLIIHEGYSLDKSLSAYEESQNRIKYFKHCIEDCDGYTVLYDGDKQIANESKLQRLFKFSWYGSTFKLDPETNNGRGESDFVVSKGQYNQDIIEFKLASNSRLNHVFDQVNVYEAANDTKQSIIVIFYFTEEEQNKAIRMISDAGFRDKIDDSIFLIDCRKDNKISASKV